MELTIKPGQPTLLNNTTCVYCGCALDSQGRTKEHVIGRRFVPTGQLHGSWNLIVWACRPCNNAKSALEDDLSAISMQPNAWGEFAGDEEPLRAEAARKSGGSFSAKTGKPVGDSREQLKLAMTLGAGISLTMGVVAPPQVDSRRIYALAQMQLMAFFYLLTYDPMSRVGRFWNGRLYYLDEARRQDWGNAQQRTFMQMVGAWDTRLIAPALANGFFRVVIRRHPTEDCFSWALEWNQNFRIAGFFGGPLAETRFNDMPPLWGHSSQQADGSILRFREESPLAIEEDRMFETQDEKS